MGWARETLRRWRGPLAASPAEGADLCFLVSSPRSGSTWTQRALNQHPEVYCTEQRLFGQFAQVWTDDVQTGAGALRITLDAYVRALSMPFDFAALGLSHEEFERETLRAISGAMLGMARARSGKRMVVDKITPYLGSSELVLSSIRAHFPAARLVYLLRDGRDVATSGVYDWLRKATPERPQSEFQARRLERLSGAAAGAPLERFFEPDELETWARYWREPLEAIAPAAELTVSFEGMKRDQRAELGRLLRCLGVDDSRATLDACIAGSSFERMSQGRAAGEGVAEAKVRKGIVGDWRNTFTRDDGARFHELTGDLLLAHGYETEPDWFERLPRSLTL